jgi:hypothetical protein
MSGQGRLQIMPRTETAGSVHVCNVIFIQWAWWR